MSMEDRLWIALVFDGTARMLWVDAREVATETVRRHGLTGRAARLAAEMILANVLLGAWIKGEERLMLQLQASDPQAAFLGEIDALGRFRGRFTPDTVDGSGLAIEGLMLAIKSLGAKELYRGVTEVDGETVASALERHLQSSAQVPARARFDVALNDDGTFERAMAVVIERLPDEGGKAIAGEGGDFDALVDQVAAIAPESLSEQLLNKELLGEPVVLLTELPLVYQCTCSRERVTNMLRSLGASELSDMVQEDKGAEITCHFCNEPYTFDEAELAALVVELSLDVEA